MNLVFLTKFYPYGTGEAFIENEIEIMSEYYDEILIITCEANKNQKMRALPKNVKVVAIDAVDKKGKILDVINGLQFAFSKDEKIVEERQNCNNIMQKGFLWYFEGKNKRLYKSIENCKELKHITQKDFMIYSYWLFSTARLGIDIKEKYTPKYMFTRAHRYDLYAKKNSLGYLPHRKLLLDEYNIILPCSDNGTEYLKHNYDIFSHKIQTALLGTIDNGIASSSSNDVFRIVSCSRVEPVKRLEKMVAALKLLDSKDYKIKWTHIGDGSKFNEIKEMAKKDISNIEIKFVGNLKNSEVLKFYSENEIDLFVNVSSSEGLPVSIMEAISFGIPTVATDVGGTNEIVMNGITGKLLEENFTENQLAEDIKEFVELKKTEKYDEYRKTCRKYWTDNFQAKENYHKLHKFINKEVIDNYEFFRESSTNKKMDENNIRAK